MFYLKVVSFHPLYLLIWDLQIWLKAHPDSHAASSCLRAPLDATRRQFRPCVQSEDPLQIWSPGNWSSEDIVLRTNLYMNILNNNNNKFQFSNQAANFSLILYPSFLQDACLLFKHSSGFISSSFSSSHSFGPSSCQLSFHRFHSLPASLDLWLSLYSASFPNLLFLPSSLVLSVYCVCFHCLTQDNLEWKQSALLRTLFYG